VRESGPVPSRLVSSKGLSNDYSKREQDPNRDRRARE
jgi:hypothetical protein